MRRNLTRIDLGKRTGMLHHATAHERSRVFVDAPGDLTARHTPDGLPCGAHYARCTVFAVGQLQGSIVAEGGPMGHELDVEPEDLHKDAARLAVVATDLKAAHDEAHSTVSGLMSPDGPSATVAALGERLAHWERETADHHQTLHDHKDGRSSAAGAFVQMESTNVQRFSDR